ncbi:MAG: phosphotransferase [Waddliaceae bacterium]|nr:phosphotransferase [Waddliaceae bacterium]
MYYSGDRIYEDLDILGISPTSVEPIIHDDAISSTVFRVHSSHGKSYIMKYFFSGDRLRREAFYLSHLRGIIPVPDIIDTVASGEDFGGALLIEDVSGVLLKSSTLSDSCASKIGETLALLHDVSVDRYGDLSNDEDVTASPREEMQIYFERSFAECSSITDASLLGLCKKFVLEHIHVLDDAEGPCIVHRDYRPGNIIVDGDDVKAVIDFENARGSFAEEDFAQMERLAWHHYPTTRNAFLQGYKTVRPLPAHLDDITPLLLVLKALGAIGFTYERKTWEGKHRHIYEDNVDFLKELFRHRLL